MHRNGMCKNPEGLSQWCVFSDSWPTDTTSSKHSVSLTWAGRVGQALDLLQLPLGLTPPACSQRKHPWRTITSAKYEAHIQNNLQTSDLSGRASCPQRLIGHSLCLQWRDHWAKFPALGLKQGKADSLSPSQMGNTAASNKSFPKSKDCFSHGLGKTKKSLTFVQEGTLESGVRLCNEPAEPLLSMFTNYSFVWVYIQEWDCWIIWQLCF